MSSGYFSCVFCVAFLRIKNNLKNANAAVILTDAGTEDYFWPCMRETNQNRMGGFGEGFIRNPPHPNKHIVCQIGFIL